MTILHAHIVSTLIVERFSFIKSGRTPTSVDFMTKKRRLRELKLPLNL